MDSEVFDQLAKALRGGANRRTLLHGLGAAFLVGLVGADASVKPKRGRARTAQRAKPKRHRAKRGQRGKDRRRSRATQRSRTGSTTTCRQAGQSCDGTQANACCNDLVCVASSPDAPRHCIAASPPPPDGPDNDCDGHVCPEGTACQQGVCKAVCDAEFTCDCSNFNNCSGHGCCTEFCSCICDEGWTGVECSIPTNQKTCPDFATCGECSEHQSEGCVWCDETLDGTSSSSGLCTAATACFIPREVC